EHFSDNATDDDNILWNNYYEYQFKKAKFVDFFITATDSQKRILSQHFSKYTHDNPLIRTVPVGSLNQLIHPEKKRQPYSMITASRLAKEKHVDWIAKAVVKAKKEVPKLTFDIYGQGKEKDKIEQIVYENNAQEYIILKGHVNLQDVYSKYELFVSA
ncbi:glycosyltransferase, partial [Enterococcus faecalis]